MIANRCRRCVTLLLGAATVILLSVPRDGSSAESFCPGGTAPDPNVIFCDDFDAEPDGGMATQDYTPRPGDNRPFSRWDFVWINGGYIAVANDIRFGNTGKSARFHYRIPATLDEHQDDNTSLIKSFAPADRVFVRGYIFFPSGTPMIGYGALPMLANGWQPRASFPNVHTTAAGSNRNIVENRRSLRRLNDVATVNSTPGSYLIVPNGNGVGGTAHLHPAEGGSPADNGRQYESETCIQRKLLYYKSTDHGGTLAPGAPPTWHWVLSSDSCPENLRIEMRLSLRPDTTGPSVDFSNLGSITRGMWHLLEVETKLNTPGLADGDFRLWLDGAVMFERRNIVLRASARPLSSVEFGRQADRVARAVIDEDRYWDNIVISRTRIGAVGAPARDILAPARPRGVAVQ